MSRPTIEAFWIDNENAAKFAEHGLSVGQVDQMLDSAFVTLRNRSDRRGLYLVIGRDHGGMCIAVPIEPTHQRGVWRPITAWGCKRGEQTHLERQGG